MTEPRNNRVGLIAVATAVLSASGLIFTVLYAQMESTRSVVIEHTSPEGGHLRLQEDMATFRQQLAELNLRTADRFTGSDWRAGSKARDEQMAAAIKLIEAMFAAIDNRVKIIEDRHVRDTERERDRR